MNLLMKCIKTRPLLIALTLASVALGSDPARADSKKLICSLTFHEIKPTSEKTAHDYRGLRNIRLEVKPSDSPTDVERAENYLHLLKFPEHLPPIRESASVTRLTPFIDLPVKYVAKLDANRPGFFLITAEGDLPRFGAYRYVDLPNGTRFSHTENGVTEHFISPRAIREGFTVSVDLKTGQPATEKYLSDQLQFRVTYDSAGNILTREAVQPLLVSTSNDILVTNKTDFVFEDGRVFEIAPGKKIMIGTVIADHANTPGILNYRNGFTELKWNPRAKAYEVTRDAEGKVVWHYISPIGSDFKNGMPVSTGRGEEIVVLYRPNSPKAIGQSIAKGYSILRLSFPNLETFFKYDAKHLYEDLEHPEKLAKLRRPHPREAGPLLTSAQIADPYTVYPDVFKTGFGPGAKPVRISMDLEGNVYQQETLGAPRYKIDHVSPEDQKNHILKPGETNWFFFGHGLRYSNQKVAVKSAGQFENGLQHRDYDGLAFITDESMKVVKRIRNGFMGPTDLLDQGSHSSIVDLRTHSAYTTGTEVMADGKLYISYGSSDHGTGLARVDMAKALREMGPESADSREGLAHAP